MTRRPDPRLHRLATIAEAVKSARLARLAAARAVLEEKQALLAGLDGGLAGGPTDPSLALADLAHRRWAEQRRARILAEIRRQEGLIDAERAAATRALARCLAFDRLRQVKLPDQLS